MSDQGAQDPQAAARFAASVAARLSEVAVDGPRWLTGCYLHGSAALGGWNRSCSDVDLLVVAFSWSPHVCRDVVAVLTSSVAACPGRGLECTVVHADAARAASAPWSFLVHVAGAGDMLQVVDGRTSPGDPDLLMHYTVSRAHGQVIVGPPARSVFGAVARTVALDHLHDELEWGLQHGTEAYAVLNALRASRFARDGSLLSKVQAGVEALGGTNSREFADATDLILRATAAQRGETTHRAPGPAAAHLVRRAQDALRRSRWPVSGTPVPGRRCRAGGAGSAAPGQRRQVSGARSRTSDAPRARPGTTMAIAPADLGASSRPYPAGPIHPAPTHPPGPIHPAPTHPPGPIHPAPTHPPGPIHPAPTHPPGPVHPAPTHPAHPADPIQPVHIVSQIFSRLEHLFDYSRDLR